MNGRGQIEGSEMQAAEQFQARLEGGFTPPVVPDLAGRLQRFRMSNNLPYSFLAQRITGIHPTTVRRAARGARICDRAAFRIERFLEEAERAL